MSTTTTLIPRLSGGAGATPTAPLLQWANGLLEVRENEAARWVRGGYVGFFVEAGHEGFDAFAARQGLPSFEARHSRANGQPEVKRHWRLGERIGFLPMCGGPLGPHMGVNWRQSAQLAASGLVVSWPIGPDGRHGRSRAAVRGYVIVPTRSGPRIWGQPIQLVASGRQTDLLLAALFRHRQLCELADGIWGGQTELWQIQLPLVAGPETTWTGAGGGQTTVTPFIHDHPATDEDVDEAALAALRAPERVAQLVARDWPGVQAWALAEVSLGDVEDGHAMQ
jgi:hypothetical protein